MIDFLKLFFGPDEQKVYMRLLDINMMLIEKLLFVTSQMYHRNLCYLLH